MITTEDDPTPLVLILANTVRRSAANDPAGLAKLNGVAAVRSANDPQAVTLNFDDGDVHLTHGVSSDVQVSITLDLELDGLPEAPSPKVSGAARHPRFALGLSKVLDPPLPKWRDAVDQFWTATKDMQGMPTGLQVTNTDSGQVHEVGSPDDAGDSFEVHAASDRLERMFTGMAFLLEEAVAGRCHIRGGLSTAAALTRAGINLALDDGSSTDGADDHG